MITAMSVADTVMIIILTMTESWCVDARSARITERMVIEHDWICY